MSQKYRETEGGVCAPAGFSANGVHCGIRKNKTKKDLALIAADKLCAVACVYTKNLVKGAPILVTQKHVANGYAQAVVVNSGNANTCNANGIEIAEGMCSLVEEYTGIKKENVVVASTGVIGQELSLDPIRAGMKELKDGLSSQKEGSDAAAVAIMTTDTVKKELAITFTLDGKTCTVGAISKGVGMICPNMATLLGFVTSDVCITPALLQRALNECVSDTVNMLTVDGDTSTNDTLCVMASGEAGNALIDKADKNYRTFRDGLKYVLTALCKKLARDGEGATRLIECRVSGAKDKKTARALAKSVVGSNLVKAMIFGADANGGRVMCALGYAGVTLDVHKIDVYFASSAGRIQVYKGGYALAFSEETAKEILLQEEITIEVDLNDGKKSAVAWGCDLTYDYVKINGDYRS